MPIIVDIILVVHEISEDVDDRSVGYVDCTYSSVLRGVEGEDFT